ncbi:hypothetical protein [Neotabrizicola sp. VNH66]|uniref:hypothetical protein n=1 Tax=Neotabrizicola sp. VNH66 TaxID=3400918 RepID=UPI003C0AA926
MIVIGGFILGAFIGAASARRQKGKAVDIAQYAFAHGILLALIGLFLTIVIDRMT